jgi:hypothetical protein
MDATTTNYTDGIVIPPLDPEIVSLAHVTTIGTSMLWGTSLTQVSSLPLPVNTNDFTHGSSYGLAKLVAYMFTPSALIGHFIPFSL